MTTPGPASRGLSDEPLNIGIPAELKARLLAYKEQVGLSQAAVTRMALNDFLTRHGFPKVAR